MLAKNLKVSAPIIAVDLTGPQRLAILIDMQEYCLVRVIDSITQKPLLTCKVEHETSGSLYHIVDEFIISYVPVHRHVEIIRLKNGFAEYTISIASAHAHAEVAVLTMADNGFHYATGDSSGKVNVWSPKLKEPRYSYKVHTASISALAFDASNSMLLSGADDGSVAIYDFDSDLLSELPLEHERAIIHLSFVHKQVFSIDRNGTLTLFDLESETILHRLELDVPLKQACMAYKQSCVIVLNEEDDLLLVNLHALDQPPLIIDSAVSAANSLSFDDENGKLIVSTTAGHLLFYDLDEDRKVVAYAHIRHDAAGISKDFVFMTVDDSKMVRTIVKKTILHSFENAQVIEAVDGAEALNKVHEMKIDCILLDWNMPEFNGDEVLRYIRAFRKFDNIKIIMATTEGDRTKILSAIKMGADGYIVKPFNADSLITSVSKYLDPNE